MSGRPASAVWQGCVPEVPALQCLLYWWGRRGRRAVPAHSNPHTEARACPTAAMIGSR